MSWPLRGSRRHCIDEMANLLKGKRMGAAVNMKLEFNTFLKGDEQFTHLLLTPLRMQAPAAFCRWKEFHPMSAHGCQVVQCKEIPKDKHNTLLCCLCSVVKRE